jgi:hypothetical protein
MRDIKKVIETDSKFRFYFEDNEDATGFRDKLKDEGFYATMESTRESGMWVLIVEKKTIIYSFFREYVMLRSPDKYVNQETEGFLSSQEGL